MTHFISTGIYRLPVLATEFEIAHLYEHLLLRQFCQLLKQNNQPLCLSGWVNGETFEEYIFIDYGLYSPKTEHLLDEFLRTENKFNPADIDEELRVLQAENKAFLSVTSREQLLSQLHQLDKRQWANLAKDMSPAVMDSELKQQKPAILTLQPNAHSYRNVSVVFGVENITADELALFSRLTPIIYDIITHALRTKFYAYDRHFQFATRSRRHQAALGLAIFTVQRGALQQKPAQLAITQALAEFKPANHAKALSHYFEAFATTPNWHYFPVDYYRSSGVVVSRPYIRSLGTPQNVEDLFSRLKVKVTPTRPGHWD